MYGNMCYLCGDRLDPGEKCNCKEKSEELERKWDRLVIKTKGQLALAIGGNLSGNRNPQEGI